MVYPEFILSYHCLVNMIYAIFWFAQTSGKLNEKDHFGSLYFELVLFRPYTSKPFIFSLHLVLVLKFLKPILRVEYIKTGYTLKPS